MRLRDATRDTLALLRALGPASVAGALARRVKSRVRSTWRERLGPADAPPPELAARLARTLRAAPSPLAPGGPAQGLHTLERSEGGARTRLVERALRAAAAPETGPGGDGDPRLAWEPARLGDLVTIAIGARAARSPAEAQALRGAFERRLAAWLEACPPPWPSALEAGLRSWNLWVAVSFLGPARLPERAAHALAVALWRHGRALDVGLEDDGLVVGSHLVGDLVGLWACGAALGVEAWRRTARARLAAEARRQVLEDGGGAEGSTGYTRFVAELWLAAVCAARAGGERPPRAIMDAAAAMLRFLAATMAPDRRDPGVGDDDDSTVLPPAARDPRDLGAILPLGPGLLGQLGRPARVPWSETAAWLAGAEGFARFRAAAAVPWPRAHAAPRFGLYVARTGGPAGDLVALRAGPNGQGGAGGHAHGDALAVAVWFDGAPAILDPGTGIYLGRRAWRDRFRGVAAHATLCVDGREPAPIPRTRPFALPDAADARALACHDDADRWRCVATHDGYGPLGVVHTREVCLDRAARAVVVTDRVDGHGERELTLTFPLAADDAVVLGGRVIASGLVLEALDATGLGWRLEAGARSPRYGAIEPAVVARRRGRARLPAVLVTRITPAPRGGVPPAPPPWGERKDG